jgi:hypothetical protein
MWIHWFNIPILDKSLQINLEAIEQAGVVSRREALSMPDGLTSEQEDASYQSAAAEQLKARNPNALYVVDRFAAGYQKNAIQADAIIYLLNTIRTHWLNEWKAGVEFGLLRGWLISF